MLDKETEKPKSIGISRRIKENPKHVKEGRQRKRDGRTENRDAAILAEEKEEQSFTIAQPEFLSLPLFLPCYL